MTAQRILGLVAVLLAVATFAVSTPHLLTIAVILLGVAVMI